MSLISDTGDAERLLKYLTDSIPQGPHPDPHAMTTTTITWVTLCKRTEDPKLRYIEAMLTERGIPNQRAGHSFHAPILQVPQEHEQAAWDMLGEKLPRRRRMTLDDMPDDHPLFRAGR